MMHLVEVPNFGQFPDGRLRAGPFRAESPAELSRLMTQYGVYPGAEDTTAMVSNTVHGLMLSAAGDLVFGYLVDRNGLEVDEEEIEEFLLKVCAPGVPCRISGHHSPNGEKMVVSECTVVNDGSAISIISSRFVQDRNGRITRFDAPDRFSLPLRLVG